MTDGGEVIEIVLHYIGKRYYSRRKFLAEAHKYGVARAIPPSHLRRLNWGDVVFMAEYERRQNEDGSTVGVARIFGYFYADKIKAFCSEEVERMALSKLRIVERYRYEKPISIVRGCGAYVIVGGIEVDNTLREVVEAYEAAAKELGQSVKFLLSGDAHCFYNDVLIEGVKFARGLQRIPVLLEELERSGLEVQEIFKRAAETGEVVFVRDYELNAYVRRDARNCKTLAEFCDDAATEVRK